MSIIIIDLFKHIHIQKQECKLLDEKFRSADYVLRIGGDEFAIVMEKMTVEHKQIIRDKIDSINEILQHPQGDFPRYSLSVGIAFSTDGFHDELFNQADQALDSDAPAWLAQLCREFPELGFEAYHGEDIYVHNPNEVTRSHLARVGGSQLLAPIGEMPTPWSKVILQQDEPYLRRVQARLLSLWGSRCEAIFSNRYLLEMTAKGCNKGAMVGKVARLLGVSPPNLYCMGDNQNDIPMLALSAIPFAPANCAREVRDWGARVLGSCDEHAVAQAIDILDSLY